MTYVHGYLMSNVPGVLLGVHLSIAVYRKYTFCLFNIPLTCDGACSVYRSFGTWPKIAKL